MNLMEMRQANTLKRGLFTRLTVVMVCMLLPLTFSCAKKKIHLDDTGEAYLESAQDKTAADLEAEQARLLEEERLLEEQRLKDAQAREAEAMTAEQKAFETFTNQDIYFEYDSAAILPRSQEILSEKAQWMRENPEVDVMVEGHTDSRGTGDYNLALGERRAENVKSFLMDLGISGSRITTISFGEERPVDPAENENAWAKNRRAHFVIR